MTNIISEEDLDLIRKAPSMPLFVLDSLGQMVKEYYQNVPSHIGSNLSRSISALYRPYCETERIAENPMGFAYVAHMRLLLVIYLTTLPLALVEQMGYTTIPVFWVIAYSLMSLEMLAVEVENPFGYQGSDLRLHQYNIILRDNIMQSWKYWVSDLEKIQQEEVRLENYTDFGEEDRKEETLECFDYW